MKTVKKYSPKALGSAQLRKLDVEGEWKDLLGEPERRGSWIVWGRSYSGKTSFCVKLARYIAEIGERVAYISLEEGSSVTMQRAFEREAAKNVNNRLSLWCDMDLEEIEAELDKQRSPQVVVIDSVQYLGINYAGYKRLRAKYPQKLFVFVSHATETKEPSGATASRIRYDASVKIMVEGFVAHAFSRYGGGEPMTIWEEGAELNTNKNQKENGKQEESSDEE